MQIYEREKGCLEIVLPESPVQLLLRASAGADFIKLFFTEKKITALKGRRFYERKNFLGKSSFIASAT
jgi:hypothetical protein